MLPMPRGSGGKPHQNRKSSNNIDVLGWLREKNRDFTEIGTRFCARRYYFYKDAAVLPLDGIGQG
jgi:hypothetical protein